MIPLAAGQYFAEHLPNARLHVLPHAGHRAMLEQPETPRTPSTQGDPA